jgi:hypothetical protein
VSRERGRTVNRAKTQKWMVKKRGEKNDKSGTKEGLEKNQKILVTMVLGRIDP